MGWTGHGLYDGDGTMSCHYEFIRKLGISKNDAEISEWMTIKGTFIPKDKQHLMTKNADKLIKSLPKKMYHEWDAFDWQMALALYLDNKVEPPQAILEKGIEATKLLMCDHASDFNSPSARRRTLRNFIKKAEKYRTVTQ